MQVFIGIVIGFVIAICVIAAYLSYRDRQCGKSGVSMVNAAGQPIQKFPFVSHDGQSKGVMSHATLAQLEAEAKAKNNLSEKQ